MIQQANRSSIPFVQFFCLMIHLCFFTTVVCRVDERNATIATITGYGRYVFLRAARLSIEQASFIHHRSVAISEAFAKVIEARCRFDSDFRSPGGRGNSRKKGKKLHTHMYRVLSFNCGWTRPRLCFGEDQA